MKLDIKLRSLLQSIADVLIDYPEKLEIQILEGEKNIIIEIFCDPGDVGKLLGKGGRVAESIRQITVAAGYRAKKSTKIYILGNK